MIPSPPSRLRKYAPPVDGSVGQVISKYGSLGASFSKERRFNCWTVSRSPDSATRSLNSGSASIDSSLPELNRRCALRRAVETLQFTHLLGIAPLFRVLA